MMLITNLGNHAQLGMTPISAPTIQCETLLGVFGVAEHESDVSFAISYMFYQVIPTTIMPLPRPMPTMVKPVYSTKQ